MIDREYKKSHPSVSGQMENISIWTVVEIAVMTAAGIGCVGLSANEDWHFYYEGTAEQAQTVTVPVETN